MTKATIDWLAHTTRFDVRCLIGGATNRLSFLGMVASIEAAVALIHEKESA